MPIDVTPTPIHPHSLPPVAYHHRGWSNSFIPPTGPARVVDILPNKPMTHMPGSILPNGLRNPWSPYAGETYTPSSEYINVQQPVVNGSAIAGCGGRSIIAPPSSAYGRGIGGGGSKYREDDGWNGSLGRNHLHHNPDISSVGLAGPTPILVGGGMGSQAGWIPSSWGNHARMTPTIAAGLTPTEQYTPSAYAGGGSVHYSPPSPLPHALRRTRRGSAGSRGIDICEECQLARTHSNTSRHSRRVSFSGIQNSPSPLRRA